MELGINEDGTKFEYAVPTYAPSVTELPTLNVNNDLTTIPNKSKETTIPTIKEEKQITNSNDKAVKNVSKTLPNTGENTNNFLSAIGLSFLALIGLLKRKKNN